MTLWLTSNLKLKESPKGLEIIPLGGKHSNYFVALEWKMLGKTIKENVRERIFLKHNGEANFAMGYEFLTPQVTLSFNATILEALNKARNFLRDNPAFVSVKKSIDPETSKLIDIVEEDGSHQYDADAISVDEYGVCVHISPKGCNVCGESADVTWNDIVAAWHTHVKNIQVGTPYEKVWLNLATKEKLACGEKFKGFVEVPEKYRDLASSLELDLIDHCSGPDFRTECFCELIKYNLTPDVVEDLYYNAQAYMPPEGDFCGKDAAEEVFSIWKED